MEMKVSVFEYGALPDMIFEDLLLLRKKTFKDRLDWAVNCKNGKEFDEYDNQDTTYIMGFLGSTVICGVRFIDFKKPNMITRTFASFFSELNIPEGKYLESSRFFVDKKRSKSLMDKLPPASLQLFLAMIDYSNKYHYDGILTLVSLQMLKILRMSGWDAIIIQEGISEKNEKVYIVKLPTDDESKCKIKNKIDFFYIKNLMVD